MRELSPEEVAQLGLDAAPAAAPAGPRALSDEEVAQLGLDGPAPAKRPGSVEALARGGLQGVTFGFGDEIAAGLESAFSNRKYSEVRDEIRAKNDAAKEAHPWLYGGAELVSGLVLPGGAAAKAGMAAGKGLLAGAGAAAKVGAKLGAISGVGHGDADLTKGDVSGAALEAAGGAALGAATGAVSAKLAGIVTGARGRADQTLLGDMTKGANKGVRDKIAGEGGQRAEAVAAGARRLKLDKAARDPDALFAQGKAAKDEIGAKLGKVYATVDQEVGIGTLPDKAVAALAELEKKYVSRGKVDATRALKGVTDDLVDVLGNAPTTEAYHGFASSLGDRAFTGLSDTAAKRVSKEISRAISGALKAHVAEASKASPKVAEVAKNYAQLNKDFGIVADIVTAASQRAKKAPFPETGLRSFTLRGLAEKASDATVGQVTRPVNNALAILVDSARKNAPGAVQRLEKLAGRSAASAAIASPEAPSLAAAALRKAIGIGPVEEEDPEALAER